MFYLNKKVMQNEDKKKKINGSKFASVIQMFLPFTLIDLIGFFLFPSLTVLECCHEWFKF